MNNTTIELPRWQGIRQVWALKIAKITVLREEEVLLEWEDKRYLPIKVEQSWVNKHKPYEGGYWIKYPNGYESYSTAKDFEAMNFPISRENNKMVEFRAWSKDGRKSYKINGLLLSQSKVTVSEISISENSDKAQIFDISDLNFEMLVCNNWINVAF